MLCLVTVTAGLVAPRTVRADEVCAWSVGELAQLEGALTRLLAAGVVEGPPGSALRPSAPLTRAEVVWVLQRAVGHRAEAEAMAGESPFADLEGHWARGAVAWAKQAGIVTGFPEGQFQPDRSASLPEIRLMLARMLRLGTGLTLETAEAALRRGGVDPGAPCVGSEGGVRPHLFLLLDRAMGLSLYARLGTDPGHASERQPRLDCRVTEADQKELEGAAGRLSRARVLLGRPDSELALVPTDLTRAEAVALIVRGLGREVEALGRSNETPLADLAGHWASGYLAVAVAEGLVRGYPDGLFRPNDTLALAELQAMLARTLRVGAEPEEAEGALLRAGVDPQVPCEGPGFGIRQQTYLLLDRVFSVPLYARFAQTEPQP